MVGRQGRDHDLAPRIDELMTQLARRVHGIRVHDGHAGAQRAEQGDRVLQDVGHHQRDPGTAREP